MNRITRRALMLKSLSAGAGGLAFAPLLNKLAALEGGTYKTPKRVVFVLFGNGFHEKGSIPKELEAPKLQGSETRTYALDRLTLPHDIEPFTPWKSRLAIIHGLRSGSVHPDHGAGFGALAAVNVGVGDDKRRNEEHHCPGGILTRSDETESRHQIIRHEKSPDEEREGPHNPRVSFLSDSQKPNGENEY